jgi:hypothetical protein
VFIALASNWTKSQSTTATEWVLVLARGLLREGKPMMMVDRARRPHGWRALGLVRPWGKDFPSGHESASVDPA